MAQRVKGQETQIVFVGPAGTEEGLTAIQSIEVEFMQEILSEGYLGDTTDRKDDVFHGVRGRAELHLESEDYFDFVNRVTSRSQRRTPADERFNIVTSLAFPNGDRKRIVIENVFFGPLPLRTGGRTEYVQATVEFEASTYRAL